MATYEVDQICPSAAYQTSYDPITSECCVSTVAHADTSHPLGHYKLMIICRTIFYTLPQAQFLFHFVGVQINISLS